MMEKKYDVFISYSSNDQIIADGVLNYLEKNRIRCFIAYRDIPKGLDWAKFIPAALRSSKLMLAIFSKDFNDSEQTDNEISIAAKRHIPILVFRITDDDFNGSKEYFLTKSNWIEAFPNPEKQFGDLYRNICYLLDIKETQQEDTSTSEQVFTSTSNAPGDDFVRKGIELYYSEDGDKEMAVYYFHKAAKLYNAMGEYMYGMAYFHGCGIPNNWKMAYNCFTSSIEHGNTEAMVQLALMYRYGIGIERNTMKALELYMKAAGRGNGQAMKDLGDVFKTGEFCIQDNKRSEGYYIQAYESLYEKAMGENDSAAQYALGNSYMDGKGVKKSYSQAVKFYERAAKNNYPAAYNALSICYGNGLGVKKDKEKSFELRLKGANMGLPLAMNNLARMYMNGEGVTKSIEKYREWQMMAADGGCAPALCDIGLDYYYGEQQEKDYDKARKCFEKSIEAGSLEGMYFLGIMYEDGNIDEPQSMEKALALYKRAAICGCVPGMICLANCYYWSKGTEEDDVNAANWYLKIADIYEEMVANDENSFLTQAGAGVITYVDFDDAVQKEFATCFENLAYLYRNGKGGLDVDSLLADKWERVCRVLRGEVENVEESEDIEEESE